MEREENQRQVFLPSHRPWKSRKTRGIPTFPTAPTAAGISQTRSGILIVVDRKECLTPDTTSCFETVPSIFVSNDDPHFAILPCGGQVHPNQCAETRTIHVVHIG